MAFLVNRHEIEAHQTSVSLLRARELRIGRGTGVDLRLDDPTVDFLHATIELIEGGRYRLRDLGSRTRTWIGEEAVSERLLESGDAIGIGGFQLTVQILGGDNPLLVHVSRQAELAAARAAGLIEEDAFGAAALPPASTGAGEAFAAFAFPARGPRRRAPANASAGSLAAYRLGGGVRPWALAAVAGLLAAAVVVALALRARHAFSPGPLGHPEAALAGQACAACHSSPFQKAADVGCMAAGCHAGVGDHQPDLAAPPSCLTCHTEHRGIEGLRLAGVDRCVDCHANLEPASSRSPVFAARIAAFAAGEHPEIAVTVVDLDGSRRVRLDEPGGREADDAGIGFPHAWHLELRRDGMQVVSCRSCHRDDGAGDMQPIAFAEVCGRCHGLDFDARLGDAVAPHAPPAEILAALEEIYAAHPELADDPTDEERRRLGGRRQTAAARSAAMARIATEGLVAKKCVTCHAVRPPDLRAEVEALAIEPVRLRQRWLPHATFRHGPHLELVECVDCHEGASSSRLSRDVLLPSIEVCQHCHRPAEKGEERETAHLGRTDCAGCHAFHPDAAELGSRQAGVGP